MGHSTHDDYLTITEGHFDTSKVIVEPLPQPGDDDPALRERTLAHLRRFRRSLEEEMEDDRYPAADVALVFAKIDEQERLVLAGEPGAVLRGLELVAMSGDIRACIMRPADLARFPWGARAWMAARNNSAKS